MIEAQTDLTDLMRSYECGEDYIRRGLRDIGLKLIEASMTE
jgi:hypothetical protein